MQQRLEVSACDLMVFASAAGRTDRDCQEREGKAGLYNLAFRRRAENLAAIVADKRAENHRIDCV